ncbi:hypothetical protein M569_10783, partial [Genlisea aurea]
KKKFVVRRRIDLLMRMDCEGCVLKLSKALTSLKGVESVSVDVKQQKATVVGYMEAEEVMKAVGKRGEIWPYVHHSLVAHPYVAGVYDRQAPPNQVRSTGDPETLNFTRTEEKLLFIFSDENPN